ncbi:MAG TPA: SBBP repeat-containing protein [Myxococcota bacterium]
MNKRILLAGLLAIVPLEASGAGTSLDFSTYLGSNGSDNTRDVVIDSQGNIYAVGGTRSSNLPTTAGTAQPAFGGYEDAYAVKFSPQGKILWSTYLGGPELDRAYAAELDGKGGLVIAGRAGAHFPVTAGAAQTQFRGGSIVPNLYPHPQDGFVAKLNATTGKKVWATFFGAVDNHAAIVRDVAVDTVSGAIYLASSTDTGTYPSSVLQAFQRGYRGARLGGFDGVLAKLAGDGRSFAWATYVGGSLQEQPTPSVRVDSLGNPIMLIASNSTNAQTTAGVYDRTQNGGADWYLAKYSAQGPLLWATYVGGNGEEGTETHNLAVRSDGAIAIAGRTTSTNIPTAVGAFDRVLTGPAECAIAIVSGAGTNFVAGSYLGGGDAEMCEGIQVDVNLGLYVSGRTYSSNFPTTASAFQRTRPGPLSPFVAVLSPDLRALRYGSYFGGPGNATARDIAVIAPNHFVFGGEATGLGYPLASAARTAVDAKIHGFVSAITVP